MNTLLKTIALLLLGCRAIRVSIIYNNCKIDKIGKVNGFVRPPFVLVDDE